MQTKRIISYIINWNKEYIRTSNTKGFIVGVSGGIDSAVTSALIAKTGIPTLCVQMPIHQQETQVERGVDHIKWLKKKFKNIDSNTIDLTSVFDNLTSNLPKKINNELALANTRARLRMTTLYYLASINNYLVVGTGNKIEDFGIGFFTKYGDGGVDISPIADLLKTEIYTISKELGILQSIITADPTDGLWKDEKTDEEQIGASYPELEWAMNHNGDKKNLNNRQKEVLTIYNQLNVENQHKMHPIPICKIPENLK